MDQGSKKHPRALASPNIDHSVRKVSRTSLPEEYQAELEKLHNKSSLVANLEPTASHFEYFEAREADAEAIFMAAQTELNMFNSALEEKKIDSVVYTEGIQGLHKLIDDNGMELRVLKRQKLHLNQDVEEMKGENAKFQESWIEVLVDKIRLVRAQTKSNFKFNQSDFRRSCLNYYGAERMVQENKQEVKSHYCVVLGVWINSEFTAFNQNYKSGVTAAHLVPEALHGSELNQLFRVGEMILAEPRNSLPLCNIIKSALDYGVIAIVPNEMDENIVASYKVVLVDESERNRSFRGQGENTQRLGSLDGKVLKFLSEEEIAKAQATLPPLAKREPARFTPGQIVDHRPAQRYMYFRCLATYFLAKRNQAKNPTLVTFIKWYESAYERMWITPGKYIRQSMLRELAMVAGNIYEPKANEMFKCEAPSETQKEDRVNAIVLKQKLLIRQKEQDEDGNKNESESESEGESEDESEDEGL